MTKPKTLTEVIEDIEKMVEDMTPLLDRVKATRRLRFTDEWYLLDSKIIMEANGWLKLVRRKYWIPCQNYAMNHTTEQLDVLDGGFGKGLPDYDNYANNLKELNAVVTSNERPFFFKIAKVNLKIREIKKCQK